MTSISHSNADTTRTPSESMRISDKLVRGLAVPVKGNRITYDAELRGFGVRITAKGVRSFILNYRCKGRERRITIGRYPEWTVLAARKQAEEYRRAIDLGNDPLENRENVRNAPTVNDLFERYAREHLPKKAPRSAADDRSMWINIILPELGPMKVAEVTSSHCDRLHQKISRDRPTRANRVIEVLRKAMNLAIRWNWIDRNPASGLQKNQEVKRTRYLSKAEIARLLDALEHHPQKVSADAIRFMLLTGCRRGEALNASWDQFDLENRIWTKPAATTKQRKEHRVPYSTDVATILAVRRAETDSTSIFAGRLGTPLTDVKKTWEAVRKTAGIVDVRLHDLRHTYASLLVSQGHSLPVIGALLGHTQAQTTARYTHLFDDPLRKATEDAALSISNSTL